MQSRPYCDQMGPQAMLFDQMGLQVVTQGWAGRRLGSAIGQATGYALLFDNVSCWTSWSGRTASCTP